MPLEIAKIKYPMEQRPAVIKTNEKTDINISLKRIKRIRRTGVI